MKILYIHQYFNTPSEAGGTRSYWMAQKLLNFSLLKIMVTFSRKIALKHVI